MEALCGKVSGHQYLKKIIRRGCKGCKVFLQAFVRNFYKSKVTFNFLVLDSFEISIFSIDIPAILWYFQKITEYYKLRTEDFPPLRWEDSPREIYAIER